MRHLKAVNQKAQRIEEFVDRISAGIEANDIVALQRGGGGGGPQGRPHVPMGCSLVFSPGWEVDSAGGTAGLCQPVERDLYDCYISCFWPVQVPDHLNSYPDWTKKCAAATKDWRNIDLVFP